MTPAMEPYLSLVVTARNDDHGGNLLGRMQAFVSGWIEQARRFEIPSELIIVEWNPPAGRPGLIDALQWPDDLGWCEVRFIEVPPEVHARYAHAKNLALYQMIAKNVGIRRARGRFVLATNIDILFSSELAGFLAKRELDPGRMYRIDRHDAMNEVPIGRPIEEQLEYCRTHLIRVNAREGTFSVSPDGRPALSPDDVTPPESGLLCGSGWFPLESQIKGETFRWASENAEVLLPEQRDTGSTTLKLQIEPGPATGGLPLNLTVECRGVSIAQFQINRRSWVCLPLPAPPANKIVLRTETLGAMAELDLRPLCFRVFRMDWEQRLSKRTAQPSVVPMGSGAKFHAAWNAMQHVINKLAHGGPLVPLTVPVSPRLRRTLKAYLEWGGMVGIVNAGPRLMRKMSRTAVTVPGNEIFPANSGLQPGSGWQKLSDYRGEGFRDASNGAEIVAAPADGGPIVLALQLEPAKSNPTRTFEVALQDESGRPLGKQVVNGLSYLKFPLNRIAGRTNVYRLSFPDSSSDGFGLRVFWCGWTTSTKSNAPEALPLPWGKGWQLDPLRRAMTSQGTAELIIRASGRPLLLDAETDAPAQIELRDSADRVLASISMHARGVYQVDLAAVGCGLRVLQLTGTVPFRVYSVEWEVAHDAAALIPEQPPLAFLHTNGCGDFTLLARERWFDLRAYPEIDVFSMNLDSMFCFAAHYGGAPEAMLADPMRIYHIEHGTGSGWTPEGQVKLFERIAAKGIPCIDNEEVLAWAKQMRRLKSPLIFNHENWGMADLDLKELTLRGRWRQSV